MLCGNKEGIYVHLSLTQFGIQQKLTKYCKEAKQFKRKKSGSKEYLQVNSVVTRKTYHRAFLFQIGR